MLIVFLIIDLLVVPFQLNFPTPLSPYISGTLKVVFSAVLISLWLFSWNKLVEIYFWKKIKKNKLMKHVVSARKEIL